MSSIHKDIEIIVPTNVDVGGTNRVRTIVHSSGASLLAWRTGHTESGGEVALVVEDVLKAIRALDAAGFDFRIDTIVLARRTNKFGVPGQLNEYLRKAGIGVRYSYVSSSEGRYVYTVFKTTDDDRAVKVLTENLLPAWVSQNEAVKSLFLGSGHS